MWHLYILLLWPWYVAHLNLIIGWLIVAWSLILSCIITKKLVHEATLLWSLILHVRNRLPLAICIKLLAYTLLMKLGAVCFLRLEAVLTPFRQVSARIRICIPRCRFGRSLLQRFCTIKVIIVSVIATIDRVTWIRWAIATINGASWLRHLRVLPKLSFCRRYSIIW